MTLVKTIQIIFVALHLKGFEGVVMSGSVKSGLSSGAFFCLLCGSVFAQSDSDWIGIVTQLRQSDLL